MNMENNIIGEKCYSFAVRIVKLYKYLNDKNRIPPLANQIVRSGTAIGALMSEASYAQSKADFLNKTHVALKEANETLYWIKILHETGYISEKQFNSLKVDCDELLRLLISTVKTTKEHLQK